MFFAYYGTNLLTSGEEKKSCRNKMISKAVLCSLAAVLSASRKRGEVRFAFYFNMNYNPILQ